MDEKVIVKLKFGSHLYGTNTKDSDIDIKGIFMPSKENILSSNVNKSYNLGEKISTGLKNTSEDSDIEMYSLHYFIKLACDGQTVALDMLHAPDNMIIEKTDLWDEIVALRSSFYTKNLKAFVGYARKQAARYGVKGSRLAAAKKIMKIIGATMSKAHIGEMKMTEVWDNLPEEKHLHHLEVDLNKSNIRQYQVCGKILQETSTCMYSLEILKRFYDNYGARARQAELNEGIDWKAVSHAIRAAYQIEEILTDQTITFPLKQADFIRDIKLGKLHYTKEVAPVLESMMERIELLSEKSDLPNKVDRNQWDNFIIKAIESEYFDGKINIIIRHRTFIQTIRKMFRC